MTAVSIVRSLTVSSLLLFCIPVVLLSQSRICYFGDSITDGWMNAEQHPELAYPAMLDSMLAAQGLAFESIVTARGGETTDDAIARIDRDVMDENADVVVFAFGSNDYFIWGVPPASRVPIERFRYNCRILLRKLSGTGARVIVLTPPPVLSSRFYKYFDSSLYSGAGGVAALRSRYADILQQLAGEIPGVRAVLSDSIFVDDSLIGFDGVHPLPEGHLRIAEALLSVISKAIGEGRSNPVHLEMMQFYPSPFMRFGTGVSAITFPAEQGGEFILRIYDSSGRQIRKIVYYAHTSGNHSIFWNGRGDDGTLVSSGAYTLSLHSFHQSFKTNAILVF